MFHRFKKGDGYRRLSAFRMTGNDNHYELALRQAALTATAEQMIYLFVIILTCSPLNPNKLWEKFKKIQINNQTLVELGLQSPRRDGIDALNSKISKEKNNPLLIESQKQAYDFIMDHVNRGIG
ncbi:hypothetical protein J437_LFUL012325 [Ladona fulva]|uniref:Uncharacterized protein n=1 Tax=Ladona fulva TaxID=123851 RepID=A0A8K0P917_LADFU|nr:hypothetical protein J437_LFUL012325 [Ladona fulva]